MRRRFLPLLVLLASITIHAAEPIAPLETFLGRLPLRDYFAGAATNGESTLVAWRNELSVYPETHTIYYRLLGGTREVATRVAAGSVARVATNGRDYLIATGHSWRGGGSVSVARVHADGSLGAARVLSRPHAYVPSVAWNGTHWLVGMREEGAAVVTELDEELATIRSIEIGSGHVARLFPAGGSFWALRHNDDRTESEIVELLPNGTTGRRHALEHFPHQIVTTPSSVLAIFRNGSDVDVATFDPAAGFVAPRRVASGVRLADAIRWEGGALLLTHDQAAAVWRAYALDASGNVIETAELSRVPSPQHHLHLAEAPEGFYLLDSRSSGRADLWAWHFRSLHDRDAPELLVSQTDFARQWAPAIASTGGEAVAFWNQVVDGGEGTAAFSRRVDAAGRPVGEPVRLPYVFGGDGPEVVRDGDRLVLVWSGRAAAVTLRGEPITGARIFAAGTDPAVARHRSGAMLAVWRGSDAQIYVTPLRADLSAEVQGGMVIPGSSDAMSAPAVAATESGFVVLWSEPAGVRSTTLSVLGYPTGSEVVPGGGARLVIASSGSSALAAWRETSTTSVLWSYRDGRPVARADALWGRWLPVTILATAPDRYLVTFLRGAYTYAAGVTLSDGVVTELSAPRLLAMTHVPKEGVALVNGTPLVVYTEGVRVFVDRHEEGRRRGVRH